MLGGADDALDKRIRWAAGERSRHRRGGTRLSAEPLADWTHQLAALTAVDAAPLRENGHPRPTVETDPIPFEDVLEPFAVRAGRMLRQRLAETLVSASTPQLSVDAWRVLERGLLASLAVVAGRPLYHEFSRTRTYGERLLIDLGVEGADESAGSASREHYRTFCAQMSFGGLERLFTTYPVLARLLATTIEQWLQTTGDFVRRLERDREAIARTFAGGMPLGPVAAVNPSLSDRHGSGATVMAVAFASGTKVVYKPKDLSLDEGLARFMDWCNRHGQMLSLQHPRALTRDGYGWSEYIEHRPCADAGAAERLFERTGMLLCVLHVLRATDCHHENLIARDDALLLVDTEALLHPREIDADIARDTTGPSAAISERFLDSVLRTGLLPRYHVSADRRVAFDVSGLGQAAVQQTPHQVERWLAVNTDGMCVRTAAAEVTGGHNLATLDGRTLSPHEYVDHIVTGFRNMYEFLSQRRASTLAPDGPMAGLHEQRVRYIVRDTQTYGSILDGAMTAEAMRDGAEFSLTFEHLAAAHLAAADRPAEWALFDAEVRALENLDIPLFTARASERHLYAGDRLLLENAFSHSSIDDARAVIDGMDDGDLSWQCQLIRGSFEALVASASPGTLHPDLPVSSDADGDDFALEAAVRIGEDIAARGLPDPSGGLTWIGLGYLLRADKYQLRVLGHNLYDGVPGIAVFLAALHRSTGDARFRARALEAASGVRSFVKLRGLHPHWRDDADAFIGGAIGLGSIVYSLVAVGRLLGDDSLAAEAQELVDAFSDERIARDGELDVMGGSAGAILGLLALHDATRDTRALEAAVRCGRHLRARQERVSSAGRAWRTLDSIPLAGMSHGAAGIAYALTRLYAATGERAWLESARDGIAYERGLGSGEGNWVDLRPGDQRESTTGLPVQWCHGAAGIGLARVGCAEAAPELDVGWEIDAAMATTSRVGLGTIDHVCCGNFGRVESLLVGAAARRRPEWRRAAVRIARAAVLRSNANGGYGLFANLPASAFQPGFFQGLAGIGYQLLRVANTDLPSVLLWQ